MEGIPALVDTRRLHVQARPIQRILYSSPTQESMKFRRCTRRIIWCGLILPEGFKATLQAMGNHGIVQYQIGILTGNDDDGGGGDDYDDDDEEEEEEV